VCLLFDCWARLFRFVVFTGGGAVELLIKTITLLLLSAVFIGRGTVTSLLLVLSYKDFFFSSNFLQKQNLSYFYKPF